jgi:hypothetical protein
MNMERGRSAISNLVP